MVPAESDATVDDLMEFVRGLTSRRAGRSSVGRIESAYRTGRVR